jgi:hypothetical protein
MQETPEHQSSLAREQLLEGAAEHADNALYNYVSILTWLRALRAVKVVMVIIPAVFGGLASWESMQMPASANIVAAYAALAGFFPVLFVALGLDERIGYYRGLAGKYRVAHSLFDNVSATWARYDLGVLEREYDRAFVEYCRTREEAHTVPRWCFVHAKKVIESGEYSLARKSTVSFGKKGGGRRSESGTKSGICGTMDGGSPDIR